MMPGIPLPAQGAMFMQMNIIPAKVQAAMCFIQHAQSVMWGPITGNMGEDRGRKLDSAEQRAYDAALQTVTEYFNSDAPFEQSAPSPTMPPGDDYGSHVTTTCT